MLLVSFVPMFLIAAAFYYMNRADPDCGTNFSWITRAIGPSVGWVAGFAVCTTGLIVIGSLADVAAYYMFDIVGWESALPTFEEGEPVSERIPTTLLATVIIIVVTAICVIGTELSARTSRIMIGAQVGALLLFAVVALVKVFGGDGADGLDRPVAVLAVAVGGQHLRRAGARPAHGRVHLLGLGERGQPQRGDRGLRQRAGPGGAGEHRAPAAHLPARHLRGDRLGRRRAA